MRSVISHSYTAVLAEIPFLLGILCMPRSGLTSQLWIELGATMEAEMVIRSFLAAPSAVD